MNRPMKTLGIGAAALLLASTAAHAATVTVQPINGSVGLATASGATISGPTTLFAEWDISAPTPGPGQELAAVNWNLEASGVFRFTLVNGTNENQDIDIDIFRARFSPETCCPPIFDSAVSAQSETETIFDTFAVAANGTLDLDEVSFAFSQGGSFTDPAELSQWLTSPDRLLEGSLSAGVSGFFISGTNFVDNSTAEMSLSVEYVYRDAPSVIPLPAAGWMLLSGMAGLGGLGWMRRRAA